MSTIPSINLNRAQEGYVNELGNHDRSYLIRLFGRFNCRETDGIVGIVSRLDRVTSCGRLKVKREQKKKIRNALPSCELSWGAARGWQRRILR